MAYIVGSAVKGIRNIGDNNKLGTGCAATVIVIPSAGLQESRCLFLINIQVAFYLKYVL